jgi:hypothetical protein
MFHSGFRPRLPVHNPPESKLQVDALDVPELQMRVAGALDAQIRSGRAPTEVSDDLAALLAAAFQRRDPSEVDDSLDLYADLLRVSPFVLRDLHNQFLSDEDQPCIRDPELKGAVSR